MAYGKEYYEQIDAYDRYLLESFRNRSYESRWFDQPDTYFQYYLHKNGAVICEFIRTGMLEDKKMILWGAGTNGKILLRYMEAHSVRLSGVVDCDEAKQGTAVYGYEIEAPDAAMQEVDHILVTSKQLEQEVSGMVRHTGAVVTDLLAMLLERKDVV